MCLYHELQQVVGRVSALAFGSGSGLRGRSVEDQLIILEEKSQLDCDTDGALIIFI